MLRRNKVRVWKYMAGIWVWHCDHETCDAPDSKRSGASIHWEIANLQANEHADDAHKPKKYIPHDVATPPGGMHFDWSDTGHITLIPEQRSDA